MLVLEIAGGIVLAMWMLANVEVIVALTGVAVIIGAFVGFLWALVHHSIAQWMIWGPLLGLLVAAAGQVVRAIVHTHKYGFAQRNS
jgi:multisubunit Na+/H+ antiporter MnhE subunit